MHYLYILYSETLDKYYVGETANTEIRLTLHNNHHFKKAFTKSALDWKIVLKKECLNKKEAIFLERFIKRMKRKKFTKKIILDSLILDDILRKR